MMPAKLYRKCMREKFKQKHLALLTLEKAVLKHTAVPMSTHVSWCAYDASVFPLTRKRTYSLAQAPPSPRAEQPTMGLRTWLQQQPLQQPRAVVHPAWQACLVLEWHVTPQLHEHVRAGA